MRLFHIICLVLIGTGVTKNTLAQQTIFGSNNYVEYQVGGLPIVISVPHGGALSPMSIPDRSCNSPVFYKDEFTVETALLIKDQLFQKTGCYPHLIISHLHRSKLDLNRNIADGACGNSDAATAWTEFHNFIRDARNEANLRYDSNTIFVDLHGHGNPIQRIELGYLLYDDELELADSVLNTTQYVNFSSIQRLVYNNKNNYTHSQLLRGAKAFGTLLDNAGFPAVPSQSIPAPGLNNDYFSGGYITANHTCYSSAAPINGFQMELNYDSLRNSLANRTRFAAAFADVVIAYLSHHFSINWLNCTPAAVPALPLEGRTSLYPNPLQKGASLTIAIPSDELERYEIIDMAGVVVLKGFFESANSAISTDNLTAGVYTVRLFKRKNPVTSVGKLIVY